MVKRQSKASMVPPVPIPVPGIGYSRFRYWGFGIKKPLKAPAKVVFLGTSLNYELHRLSGKRPPWRNGVCVYIIVVTSRWCSSLTFCNASLWRIYVSYCEVFMYVILWLASAYFDIFSHEDENELIKLVFFVHVHDFREKLWVSRLTNTVYVILIGPGTGYETR